MKCPKCNATEGIKWFLRHQATEDEESDETNANVITMLCTQCGYNESYFLEDSLELIFPSWNEYFQIQQQQMILDNTQEMFIDEFENEEKVDELD